MLQLRGVVAGYGGGDVLQGVDIDVPRGAEIVTGTRPLKPADVLVWR